MYIDRDKIEDLHEILYYGTYGNILKVKYNNQIYAQKKFISDMYTPSISDIKKFEAYSSINAQKNEIYLPEYLVDQNNFNSYLTSIYNGNNFRHLINKPLDTKILFLNKARELIIKTNKDYGIIHSDIHFGNIMYNDDEKTTALIDFDSSKYEDLECEKCYLSDFASDYLTYNDYDDKLDIYLFNLLTLGLLFDQSMKITYSDLGCKRFHNYFYDKNTIKILEDMSNIKGNENFIIDMIDNNVKSRILKIY